MRAAVLAVLLALPLPATAETLSAEIGRTGIAATEARLTALPTPSDEERFALGGLRFLGAVEAAMQQRWRYGLSDHSGGMLPFLRAPIDENPSPAAFDPALIATIFRDVSTRMEGARDALSQIAPGSDFGLEIKFADIWFDINANHSRDKGEDMMDIFGPLLLGWDWVNRDPATPAPVVRFDAADAPWLSAYTHLVSGLADMILAYDPTEPTKRILAARAAMNKLGPVSQDYFFGDSSNREGPDSLDLIAIVLETLNQAPNASYMTSARDHLLAMITDNRRFWAEVAKETDNQNEWLPNDQQTSALGVTLPVGTGVAWMAMLADLEAVLNGKLLVTYWRYDGGVGVNVAKLFTNPRPIDLAGWIQGWAALPYLERGPLVGPQSAAALDNLMLGNPMLVTLYLN